ncbi:MAG: class I SAM-dependent methyltransferase [Gammaproteobacteria bacterium]|nr:class I SAM-dependent methyltransferase [Gammaproteobacteria bacterium]
MLSPLEFDRGLADHMSVLEEFLPLDGKFIVDVGCGDGSLCRELAKRGAATLGVETDPVQVAKNRVAEITPNVGLTEGVAQNLPLETGQVDAVMFHYSFHHVPVEEMPAAIAEALRVLKPDGYLFVKEPIAEGLMQDAVKYFHDETLVRDAALEALNNHARERFLTEKIIRYRTSREFRDFEHFAGFFTELSYNSGYTEQDVRTPAVRSAFEKAKRGETYVFEQPVRLNLYQGVRH